MAQNLDPSSDGRGVLQFKTGLASVIKVCPVLSFFFLFQSLFRLMVPLLYLTVYVCHATLQQKLAKKDGASIDRQNDIEVLWNFYLEYKSRRRVDDMQREQERMRESGNFSTEYVPFLLSYMLWSYFFT
jgi:callose synthase